VTTSSAEPARLQRYPDDLSAPDSKLSTLAGDLNTAMDDFMTGAGEFLPAGFDSDWAGSFVQGLHDESVHLGQWVKSVGDGFVAVGTDTDGDGILDVEDRALAPLVGEPTRAEAQEEADGRAAAARVRAALAAAGYDPDHFDPASIRLLASNDPQFRALYGELVGVGDRMWNEDFSAGFYDSLGVEGTHVLLGVVDLYAARRVSHGIFDDVDWIGDPRTELLGPFVEGWARATDSPDLSDDRAALLATEDPVDQRHLSLLMTGNPRDYDPTWLADAAERILVTGADLNRAQYPASYPGGPDEYPGFNHGGWLYGDPGIGVPQVVAMRALDGNTATAWTYASRGQANIDALVHPEGLNVPQYPEIYEEVEALRAEVDSRSAGAIQNAFLRAQYETVPDPNDPTKRIPLVDPAKDAAAYDDFMESIAAGDTSDLMKRAAASTLLPHLDTIAAAANEQAERPGPDANALFQRQDVVGFFKEIGYDEEAAGIAGHEIGLWAGAETSQLFADHPHPTPGQLQGTYDPIAQVVGAAYNGFNDTEAAAAVANSHLAYGISHGVSAIADLTPGVVALLSANPVTAAGTLVIGVGVDIVGQAALFGIEDIRGADTSLPFGGEDLQRQVVTDLRAQAVHQLEAQGAIPPGTQPGEYSGVLADYFGGTDPYDDLNESSFVNAFNYSTGDPW
jgi:hypothetical protein